MPETLFREKDKCVFDNIVEIYLKNGKPVSSSQISQKSEFSVSSATVRNIMAKLEKMGFLQQPHTSAGRIPTDEGLRFYVNSMFDDDMLPDRPVELMTKEFALEEGEGDFNSLFSQVSKTLSDCTDSLGFVLSPSISKVNFRHLRFIKISEEKVMIILVTTSKLVLTEVVKVKDYFTQLELDNSARYINENFRGKSLSNIQDYLLKEVPKFKMRFEDIIQKLLSLLHAYMSQEDSEGKIFLEGSSKLLLNPDIFDKNNIRALFASFEEKAKLTKLLSDIISLDKVKVLIGSELNIPNISDCSIILSHYGYDRQVLGSLGVLGSKRIPYKKIIPLVESIAKKLSKAISSGH
ncbi:heat-inducible transcriptional repressor HrcA [Acidobacteriota bacterium]